ncbi:MAG TPA: hypothetical protein VLQ93_09645 [Myxococcaceae bacterium]|nr:hypothetical protein [Myxococcaceae bacterium]
MRFSGRRLERWGVLLALVWVFTAQRVLAQAEPPLEAPVPLPAPEEELPQLEPSRWLEAVDEQAVPEEERPPMLRVFLGSAVPWRQYCARPGATSCGEFDARDPSLRQGDSVDFRSQVPYAGGALEVELFPLTRQQSPLSGLGLTASYQHAFARTRVQVRSPTGQSPAREVFATDQAFEAMLAWRYFFGLGRGARPLWGHGGLRLGLMGRAFAGDEAVDSPLPVTHRLFPAVGLDVSVPMLRVLRVFGAGRLFLRPRPGEGELLFGGSTLAAEVRDHGESVSSLGWSAELGVAGELWGPVGYSARFRLTSFHDGFSGKGTRRGWLAGGVAEELYATALAGVTLSW